MKKIEDTDFIKVPYEQFEMLMIACCLQNDCEGKSTCRCREYGTKGNKLKSISEALGESENG